MLQLVHKNLVGNQYDDEIHQQFEGKHAATPIKGHAILQVRCITADAENPQNPA
jgi:hypothetical protein